MIGPTTPGVPSERAIKSSTSSVLPPSPAGLSPAAMNSRGVLYCHYTAPRPVPPGTRTLRLQWQLHAQPLSPYTQWTPPPAPQEALSQQLLGMATWGGTPAAKAPVRLHRNAPTQPVPVHTTGIGPVPATGDGQPVALPNQDQRDAQAAPTAQPARSQHGTRRPCTHNG